MPCVCKNLSLALVTLKPVLAPVDRPMELALGLGGDLDASTIDAMRARLISAFDNRPTQAT